MELVLSKKRTAPPPSSEPLAKLEVKPATPLPAATPLPSPSDPKPAPAPAPSPPAPSAEPERTTEPAPYVSPTSIRLPEGTSGRIADAVSKGDRYYDEAMKHLNLSNPQVSPTNWADENHQALVLFKKANDEGYLPAQDMYGASPIPQALLDRVRDTTMCSAMCRKRSVSTKR
jgi:hypothetical protein